MTFAEIFDTLLVPRENGSDALARVAQWIAQAGRAAGADVAVHEFVCRPYAHLVAGFVVLLAGAAFVAAAWRRRFGWALAAALVIPAYLALELEYYVPVLSWLVTARESNIALTFPVTDPVQTVVLGAHYDTATTLLGFSQRAPLQFLIIPMVLLSVGTAVSGWRRLRRNAGLRGVQIAAGAAGVYYAALFLALSGGAFVPARGPGALDDGASVAVLLRVAEALGANEVKLERTEVRIVLFAGAKVGTQGSWDYVRTVYPDPPARPTYFVNAAGLGAGPELRYFPSDRFALRRYDASGPLIRVLDTAWRRISGQGLEPDIAPVMTDARSFMAAGIPSVCLTSAGTTEPSLRGLHAAGDSQDRIDGPALERILRFYKVALLELDRAPDGVRLPARPPPA